MERDTAGRYAQAPFEERFWNKVDKSGECWVWLGRRQKGYGVIQMGNGTRPLRAHRVSYEFVHGPIPPGRNVCHSCDNPWCVRPEHLWLGSHSDNNADKVRKHRQARGSIQGHAKLTEADVLAIRERYEPGGGGPAGDRTTMYSLAAEYGVTPSAIFLVIKRRNWRHI